MSRATSFERKARRAGLQFAIDRAKITSFDYI